MLKFNKNGKFLILQVADAQDLHFIRHTMVRMLNKAYGKIEPDLIVLTGDNILGNHLRDARFGSREVVHNKAGEEKVLRTAIDKLVAPIERRKIPFAMIYGNHDDRNSFTKDEQADIYREYSCCIGLDNPDKSVDCDTYNIPIFSSDGKKVAYNLWMLDSAWYDREQDKCFEYVKPEAVEWYKRKSAQLKAENGGEPVPSLMFQHIPMAETLDLIEECRIWEDGAVPGPDGKFFKLKKGCKGSLGEYPSVCSQKNGQLDAMNECGDVKAVVFSHDHTNCFTAKFGDIDVVQSSAASFRCYGNRMRGVRAFLLDEKTGEYESDFFTYDEICGGGILNEICYVWDADGMAKEKIIMTSAFAAGAIGAAAGLHKLIRRCKK